MNLSEYWSYSSSVAGNSQIGCRLLLKWLELEWTWKLSSRSRTWSNWSHVTVSPPVRAANTKSLSSELEHNVWPNARATTTNADNLKSLTMLTMIMIPIPSCVPPSFEFLIGISNYKLSNDKRSQHASSSTALHDDELKGTLIFNLQSYFDPYVCASVDK